jgi:hypothetical protein
VRLAEAAIAAGLFPGNEPAVRELAAASSPTIEEVALDLSADPRIDAEELRRLTEERIRQTAEAAKQGEQFKQLFHIGEPVHFDAGSRQGVITGKLIRINKRTCTVEGARGVKWYVPPSFLRPGPAPPEAKPAERPLQPRDRFAAGDRVSFRLPRGGKRVEGTIIRRNPKTATVQTEEGRWRVGFRYLTRVKER